jgi:pantothenate synthetase
VLYSCIEEALKSVAAGTSDCQALLQQLNEILAAAAVDQVDYVAIVDPETLRPLQQLDRPARLLLAVYIGTVRLIDNCLLPTPAATGSGDSP